MKTFHILLLVWCIVFSLVPQEKTVILDNGDVIHGQVKETETVIKVKTKRFGVLEIDKAAVKKIIDVETNAALSDERDLSATGMTAAPSAGENKIAVNDFSVRSDNPEYKFMGKGFSELIAYEVKKSPRVHLVEREKRNELFKEVELSMTGLVDEKDAVKAGKLLACDYIVFGEIVDMAGSLMLSLRMTRVDSGEVVWRKQLTEPGKNYPYISAFFAKSMLSQLRLSVDQSTEDMLASRKTMDQDAVVKLSKGIDAYDNKDMAKAKAELDAAKQLDPNNKVVQAFLNKLSGATSKFKVVPERYVSMVNPAYLGAAKQDRLYGSVSMQNLAGNFASRNIDLAMWVTTPTGTNQNGYGSWEQGQETVFGYVLPLMKGWGIGIEYNMMRFGDMISSGVKSETEHGNLWTTANYDAVYHRGMLTTGFSIGDWFGIGAGVSVGWREIGMIGSGWGHQTPHTYMAKGDTVGKTGWLADYDYDIRLMYGGELGILIKDPSDTVLFDTLVSYNPDKAYYFISSNTNYAPYTVPVFVENTVTLAVNEKRTFIVLKQMNEIYFADRGMYVGKIMPAVEHWVLDWFSLRAGIEGTLIVFPSKSLPAWGALVGITPRVKFGSMNLDIDVNYTYRPRPSRVIDGFIINEQLVFATVSLSGLFINRD